MVVFGLLTTAIFASAPSLAAIAFRAASSASAVSGQATTITYVASGSAASSSSGNVTPTLPARQAGDLLVCLVESHDTSTHTISPASWTQLYSMTGTAHRASLFYKIAGASETNPTISHSGDSIIANCSSFRGVDTATPFDVAYAAQYSASDQTVETGSLTTVTSGAVLLFAALINNNPGGITVTTTGGFTWTQAFHSTTGLGQDSAVSLLYATQASAGAAGPLQGTTSSNAGESHGVLLALRPNAVVSSDLTISLPAGTVTGDVMVASIVVTPSTVGITPPSGWTLVIDTVHNANGGDGHLATYVRTAGGSEPANYTWSFAAGHSGAVGGIAAFSGVDTADPIVNSAELKEDGNTATAHAAPSINATSGDMLVTIHEYQSSGTWTPPGGMTEAVDRYSAAAAGTGGVSLGMNYLLLSAPGATGTKTATASGNGDEGASQSVALRALCALPSDLAAWASGQGITLSCVCDTFGRTSLNPSTIYGQNWAVGSVSGTFGNPRIVNFGFLRLTDNTTTVSTVANVPGTFPAAGNVIYVDFRHYAYNGATGADGIALTLSDANVTPVPGAFGGALGYAQKCQNGVGGCSSDCNTPGGCPGFSGGWVGVGIDEYGRYSANTEGKDGPPSGSADVPDSVAVRGSGSGMLGYPYLAGSAGLSPGIDNVGSASPAYGHMYRIMVDARQYATGHTNVSVSRDTTGTGNSFLPVVGSFDVFQAYPSQSTVPQYWKLSFTGSTGASTNIHEIAGLRICAQAATPPSGYVIEVDNSSPSTCGTPGGNPSSPIITVKAVDSGGNIITNYTQTVTLAATLSGGGSSAAVWSKVTGYANGALSASSGNGSQTYTFVSADTGVAKFYLTDASSQDIYITVTESDGSPSTSLGSPILYRGGSFTLSYPDTLGTGVVAGRAHKFTVTRTTCSGGQNNPDTSYTGNRSLDGWYNPLTGHPSGANAPQICATNISALCLPSTGTPCVTLPDTEPNLSSSSNNLSMNFSAGVANFCLVTSDVGKYSLSVRDDSNISAPVRGSTTDLIARPFAVVVYDVMQGTTNNPATTDPNSATSLVAGANFQATAGGYLWNSSADANGDGMPDSVSLATMTGTGMAPHYADAVGLSADTSVSTNFAPEAPPATRGTLTGSITVSTGSGTSTSLNYNEVGSFTLKASPSDNYPSSPGVDLRPRVAIYAKPADTTAQNRWVGRFRPDHFTVVGAISNACSTGAFTYMNQPFTMSRSGDPSKAEVVEARNAGDNVTQNYSGTTWGKGTVAFGLENADSGTNLASSLAFYGGGSYGAIGGNWVNGIYTLTGNDTVVSFKRPTSPPGTAWGPFNALDIGLSVTDADVPAPAVSGADMDPATSGACGGPGVNCNYKKFSGSGSMRVRYGILRLENAAGSELLNLRLWLRAQYYSAGGWVTNADDSCTQIPNARNNISMGNCNGTLSCTTGGNMDPATHLPNTAVTLSGGANTVLLTAPTCAAAPCPTGSLDFALTLGTTQANNNCVASPAALPPAGSGASLPWLWGNWCGGTWSRDPNARATFGTPRSRHIYLRERY